jgi:hypothetical protein
MANRFFNQFRGALEKGTVDLFAKITVSGGGAPTLVTANSKGFTSITRNSPGNYTLQLQDKYQRLLGFKVGFQSESGIAAAPNVGLSGAPGVAGATPVVQFVCSLGGVATDPASGETMYVAVTLSNSTAL